LPTVRHFRPPESPCPGDFYVAFERMETDLRKVIRSKQVLTDEHTSYFTYQMFRGLKYMHAAGVVHKQLTSASVLVNKECDLKLCDFSAAGAPSVQDDIPVSSIRYAALEVLLLAKATFASDIWALGCIMCELLGRQPVFQSFTRETQISEILRLRGAPPEGELEGFLPAASKPDLIARLMCAEPPAASLASLFPQASCFALSLASSLLQVGPLGRPSAAQALAHPYYRELHDPGDEPSARPFPWQSLELDAADADARWRHLYLECMCFREKALTERDGAALEDLGIGALLREKKARGRFAPHWRPLVRSHWLLVSLVVLKSDHDGVRAVAAAMTDLGLRLKLFSFLLPSSVFNAPGSAEKEAANSSVGS